VKITCTKPTGLKEEKLEVDHFSPSPFCSQIFSATHWTTVTEQHQQ
jgi:hypothetical protein